MKTNTPIPFVDLGAQYRAERAQLLPAIEAVLESGHYIGGAEVDTLEAELAEACGTKHCIALNSGTDAILMALAAHGIGRGEEVITQANSFVATAAAIIHIGAVPVFADVLPDQSIDPADIEQKITDKTRAIMPVHLTGRIGDMDAITKLARQYDLLVIEDAAQSFGSSWRGKKAGALGDIAAFSAHPLKNLNAVGDAGYLTTDNDEIAETIRLHRNHGLVDRNTVVQWGTVSRLDAVQATILRHRLKTAPDLIAARRKNAAFYLEHLDSSAIYMPQPRPDAVDTYHTFVVQLDHRDQLVARLTEEQIGHGIHYPVPIHKQPAYAKSFDEIPNLPETERQAGRILSLPIHQSLSQNQLERVVAVVNDCVNAQARTIP